MALPGIGAPERRDVARFNVTYHLGLHFVHNYCSTAEVARAVQYISGGPKLAYNQQHGKAGGCCVGLLGISG